jgi:hypothetical protein
MKVTTHLIHQRMLAALAAFAVVLAACDTATPQPPTATPKPADTATPLPVPTEAPATPVPPTAMPNETGVNLTVPPEIAQSNTTSVVPAVPRSDEPAFGGAAPAHVLVSFDSDKLTGSPRERQIRIYPVEGLRAIDPVIAQEVDKLKDALAKKPETIEDGAPLLPVQAAAQVFYSQLRYVDFANGSGLRYITAYAQDITPITNENAFYTFQGLTSDGKYYIAAFYPLSSTVLPNSFADSPAAQDVDAFSKPEKYEKYLTDVAAGLNSLPPDQFSPDLSQLDTMLQSLSATPTLPDEAAASANAPAAEGTPAATPAAAQATNQVATISADEAKPAGTATVRSLVNVRSGPSTRTRTLTQLRRNAQVQLLGRDAGARWIYVQYDEGKKGWVSASFLRSVVRLRTLPVIK